MYVIEMFDGCIFEAEMGKLANRCISIARTLVDNKEPYCNLKSLTFINCHGAELIFSRYAISQLENKIEAHQSEIRARDKEYTEYNKYGNNYTDNHF